MTQSDLCFDDPCRVPASNTQNGMLVRAFQRGETLTVAESLSRYGVYALSQRVGELKRMGWQIDAERYKTPGGAIVCRYSMRAA